VNEFTIEQSTLSAALRRRTPPRRMASRCT
jgi:hypothetical protein